MVEMAMMSSTNEIQVLQVQMASKDQTIQQLSSKFEFASQDMRTEN